MCLGVISSIQLRSHSPLKHPAQSKGLSSSSGCTTSPRLYNSNSLLLTRQSRVNVISRSFASGRVHFNNFLYSFGISTNGKRSDIFLGEKSI